MHLVLCQPDIAWEDKPSTFARVQALLAPCRVPAGSLIILPEMFATGFSMNASATSELEDGPTEAFLRTLSRVHGSCVLAGLAVTDAHGIPRNQAVAVAPDGTVLARYSKQKPFSLAAEERTFPAGDESIVFDWGGFRIAPLICYDLRFPELFRNSTACQATLFAVIANWPEPRHHHWRALLTARAIENQAAVVGVNRAGLDPGHVYAGGSMVLDAHGLTVAEAGDREAVVTAELDPAVVTSWRAAFPAHQDAGHLK